MTQAKKKSPTNETTEAIIKYIRSIPHAYVWRNNTTGIFDKATGAYRPTNAKKGVSDIIGGFPHKIFKERPPIAQLICIEVKTGRDRLSAEQEGFLATMRHIGAITLVVKSYEDFLEQFNPYAPIQS